MNTNDWLIIVWTLAITGLLFTSIAIGMFLVPWLMSWYRTWRILRSLDPEQRAILTGEFDISDFVEVDRPE